MVFGRVLKWSPSFPPLGILALNNPFTLSVGRTFKYCGIVTALIRLPCITNGNGIFITAIILYYLEGKLESGVFPRVLEESEHPCFK